MNSGAKVIETQASVPGSEHSCVMQVSTVGKVWCELGSASAGLQSVQIIGLFLIGLFGIWWRYWRPRARNKRELATRGLNKKVIRVCDSRLTAICTNGLGTYFTGGFSGIVYELTAKRVARKSDASFGLIRSLILLPSIRAVLVGSDDGSLSALDLDTFAATRLLHVDSAIFAIARMDSDQISLGLANGEVRIVEVQRSPAQAGFSTRALATLKTHDGGVFGLSANRTEIVACGAEGKVVWIARNSVSVSATVTIGKETLWCIAPGASAQLFVAANSGDVYLLKAKKVSQTRRVHKASIRNLSMSPKGNWCFSMGKDRAVFASTPALGESLLLHQTDDYIYDSAFSDAGNELSICDGAGVVTIFGWNQPIDNLSFAELRAACI